MIKQIILTLIIFLIPISTFAQSSDIKVHNEDNRTWLNENYLKEFSYPITLGVYGFYNASWVTNNNYSSDIFNGGGGAVTVKISFLKWLAFALDLSYSGSSMRFSSYYKEDIGTFLFSPMVVFQRETLRGQAGWAPFFGIGISISDNTLKATYINYYGNEYSETIHKSGIGVIMNTGINYNFKNNAFIGGRLDYSASSFSPITMNNFRIGLQTGYRF